MLLFDFVVVGVFVREAAGPAPAHGVAVSAVQVTSQPLPLQVRRLIPATVEG